MEEKKYINIEDIYIFNKNKNKIDSNFQSKIRLKIFEGEIGAFFLREDSNFLYTKIWKIIENQKLDDWVLISNSFFFDGHEFENISNKKLITSDLIDILYKEDSFATKNSEISSVHENIYKHIKWILEKNKASFKSKNDQKYSANNIQYLMDNLKLKYLNLINKTYEKNLSFLENWEEKISKYRDLYENNGEKAITTILSFFKSVNSLLVYHQKKYSIVFHDSYKEFLTLNKNLKNTFFLDTTNLDKLKKEINHTRTISFFNFNSLSQREDFFVLKKEIDNILLNQNNRIRNIKKMIDSFIFSYENLYKIENSPYNKTHTNNKPLFYLKRKLVFQKAARVLRKNKKFLVYLDKDHLNSFIENFKKYSLDFIHNNLFYINDKYSHVKQIRNIIFFEFNFDFKPYLLLSSSNKKRYKNEIKAVQNQLISYQNQINIFLFKNFKKDLQKDYEADNLEYLYKEEYADIHWKQKKISENHTKIISNLDSKIYNLLERNNQVILNIKKLINEASNINEAIEKKDNKSSYISYNKKWAKIILKNIDNLKLLTQSISYLNLYFKNLNSKKNHYEIFVKMYYEYLLMIDKIKINGDYLLTIHNDLDDFEKIKISFLISQLKNPFLIFINLLDKSFSKNELTKIIGLFGSITRQKKQAIIFFLNDKHLVFNLTNRVWIFAKNSLVEFGKTHKVFLNPINIFSKKMIYHDKDKYLRDIVDYDIDKEEKTFNKYTDDHFVFSTQNEFLLWSKTLKGDMDAYITDKKISNFYTDKSPTTLLDLESVVSYPKEFMLIDISKK
ncbi:MAG1360 family OppF-related protein [Mycoplasmopsis pulmonis]|uniref:MAG1360 family OppF-related protein n=1 Tax=Mycoplasmopsis pulmonis TaxID=2107 RepID=UPI002ACEC453|nr:hypothetical protein [Mycoplasmopsis pulmonis]MDZ7293215.1 hypothetical protein [Mycoplasmopsis pulmonis]